MSDNFGNNNYDAYFKILEENLEKSRMNGDKENRVNKAVKKPVKRHRSKKGIYKVFRLRITVLAVFLIVAIVITAAIVLPKSPKAAEKPAEKTKSDIVIPVEPKVEKIEYTETENTEAIPATNDARYAIIIDKRDNTIVASRKPKARAYPASTTKIMTLLTAVEHIVDYSHTFTMSYEITDPLFVEEASVAGFLNGETVNMTDLLYGMILPSGADAAMALAIHIAGSEENFVRLMNEKVDELGLTGTHFDNVTGLHSETNYSTVYDMAIILDAAMQNPVCKKILSTYQYTTAKTSHHPEGILLSSTLFTYMYGTEPETATIQGGKTGFVNESGYCIASYGSNNTTKNEYIVVTFGNSARMPAFFGQIDLYKEYVK